MATVSEVRSVRLAAGQVLRLSSAGGRSVTCCAGVVRVEQPTVSPAILHAGERLTLTVDASATIEALQGLQSVWTGDCGIAVVCLCLDREP